MKNIPRGILLSPKVIGSLIASSALAIASLLPGCKAGAMMMMGPTTAPVVVAMATTRDVPVYLDEIGKCSASESVNIIPQVGGQILKRDFEDGQDVKKDSPLFDIDPAPFEAAVEQAQANLAQQSAALEFAQEDFAHDETLINTNAVSKQDYDTKKNAVAVDQALVAAAQATLRVAKINLNYCSIKSPIDGRAGQRLVDAGNVVKANDIPLLNIQTLDPIYADFTIGERDLAAVRDAIAASPEHQLTVLVGTPGDTEPHPGQLIFLDNAVKDATGTVNLRAKLQNADHHFWPGQFVNIRLVLRIQKDAVLVPSEAIEISQQGQYIYVVTDGVDDKNQPAKIAKQRFVTVGQRQGGQVVILDGIKPNDTVIVQGQLGVVPDKPVKITEGTGASS